MQANFPHEIGCLPFQDDVLWLAQVPKFRHFRH